MSRVPIAERLRRKGEVTFSSLKESYKGLLDSDWVDNEAVPGDTPYEEVSTRIAGEILKALNDGKEVVDKDGLTYRWTQNKDWDDDNIAVEWTTLNGEKMIIIEKGDKRLLLFDDLGSVSEFVELRIAKLYGMDGDIAKIEDEFIKKEKESTGKDPEPAKPAEEPVRESAVEKAIREARAKFKEAKDPNFEPAAPVATSTDAGDGVGGDKSGVEVDYGVDPFLDEAYGDTNPTQWLIWFPKFLKDRLAMVGALCANTSDSWNEFGTKEQGKIYTSSYKIRPKFGGNILMDLSLIDCDDHWELEYELSQEGGDWEQITNKSGENIIKAPKDQLRQVFGKIVSLCKEVCKKRSVPDFKPETDDLVLPPEEGEDKGGDLAQLVKRESKVCESFTQKTRRLLCSGYQPTKIAHKGDLVESVKEFSDPA